MSEIDTIIAAAARLPPRDAAHYLWRRKENLDRLELPVSTPTMKDADLKDPATFKRVVRAAIETVVHERATAHNGATFGRLKRAHPGANDDDLKAAIKAAAKLDRDCLRNYRDEEGSIATNAQRAVDRSRADNPGFLESTYVAAADDLMFAMR
jgi:hypothetical protein